MLFVLLCISGVLLGMLQSRFKSDGRLDPVSNAVLASIGAPSDALATIADFASGGAMAMVSGRRLMAENRMLRAQLSALATYGERIELLEKELENTRKLAGFGPVRGKVRVPATIVGHVPAEHVITLDVGEDRQVRRGAAVITSRGLLGTVQAVSKHRCQVMLLTHGDLKIGAMNQSRRPPPAGLYSGKTRSVVFQDPRAPVEVGDLIVTSGLSEYLPRSIILGKVIAVEDSLEDGTRRAIIDPAVTVGEVREVQVLR